MAGCRSDENQCKPDVLSVDKGHTSGLECDVGDDRPCVTTCGVIGSREGGNGSMNPALCCAACTYA